MAKYRLILSGWEIEASAHHITKEENDRIQEHIEENDVECLHDIMNELEDMVEGYSRQNANMFSISKPLLYDDNTYFTVEDEEGNEVLSFNLGDIEHDYEKYEDAEREKYDADPDATGHDFVIFAVDENKGQLFACEFECDDEPKVEDFDFLDNYINTPDGESDIIEEIFFRGHKLEKDYDYCDTSGKSSGTEIFTKQ